MLQKIDFNNVLAIKGMGRVDDIRPVDLQEYVIPVAQSIRKTPIPVIPIPNRGQRNHIAAVQGLDFVHETVTHRFVSSVAGIV